MRGHRVSERSTLSSDKISFFCFVFLAVVKVRHLCITDTLVREACLACADGSRTVLQDTKETIRYTHLLNIGRPYQK